jgi:Small nuclear RNA activating complex (SNAPc), subunit 1
VNKLLYFRRPTLDEVNEFTELLFFVVKDMVLPPNSLTRRLCSMYILYGVYIKQPGEGFCQFKVISFFPYNFNF